MDSPEPSPLTPDQMRWLIELDLFTHPLLKFLQDSPPTLELVQVRGILAGVLVLAGRSMWAEIAMLHKYVLSVMPEELVPGTDVARKTAYFREVFGDD